MSLYMDKVKAYLDQEGIIYKDGNEDVLSVTYSGEQLSEIRILIAFDTEDAKAEFSCFSIGKFDEEQFPKGLIACNSCNARYRWAKFYIDDENYVGVRADAILDEDSCGEECLELIIRLVNIVDEAYPVFMKARWA